VNVGALMEKGVRLIGNGQAPVHLYWKEILNDYIIPGKFDPTLCVFPIRSRYQPIPWLCFPPSKDDSTYECGVFPVL
jgi:hypothetical protein